VAGLTAPPPQNIGLDSRPPNGLPGIQAKTQGPWYYDLIPCDYQPSI